MNKCGWIYEEVDLVQDAKWIGYFWRIHNKKNNGRYSISNLKRLNKRWVLLDTEQKYEVAVDIVGKFKASMFVELMNNIDYKLINRGNKI